MDNKNYGILISLGLTGMAIWIWPEIASIWAVEQNWEKLLSPAGIVSVSLYLLLFIAGVYFLIAF